jgi:hypothetical protein
MTCAARERAAQPFDAPDDISDTVKGKSGFLGGLRR